MNLKSTLQSATAAMLLSGMLAGPVLAADTGNGAGNGTSNGGTLSGTLQKSHDMWRASDIKGATVYNSAGQQIGTVDGILLNSSGSVTEAVISVGGFAGVGDKLVRLPFSKLKFEPSQSGNHDNNGPVNYSIVYPGATKQSLKDMPAFTYNNAPSS